MNNIRVLFISLAALAIALVLLPSPWKTRAYTPNGTVQVRFNPGSSNVTAGSSVNADLQMNTNSIQISGAQIIVTIAGVTNFTFTPATISGLEILGNQKIGNQMLFALGVSPGAATGYSNSTYTNLGTLNFAAPTTGTVSLTFSSLAGDNKVLDFQTNTDIMAAPTNPIYTVQTSQPTAGTINLKFRLQGITEVVPTQNFTFAAKNPTTNASLATIAPKSLIPDDQGVYTTSLIGLPLNVPIKVCIKSPSHLQRCTSDNSVNPRRATSITLSTAAPTASLDMSSDSSNQLIVGDLNGSNSITQADQNTMASCYSGAFIVLPPGPPYQTVCDVNLDGRVTIDDSALVVMNYKDFEIKGDDYGL